MTGGSHVLVYSEAFSMHTPPRGSNHLESPYRLSRAIRAIRRSGLLDSKWVKLRPRLGDLSVFKTVHSPEYLDDLKAEIDSALDSYFIDSDTYISAGTMAALQALAGSIVEAEKLLESTPVKSIIILSRPPSHHAGFSGPGLSAPSLGSCLVNATAALALNLASRGLNVVVVDFDLGHGNGTQEILRALSGSIPFIDIHQDYRKTFPWTGGPQDSGENTLNINLPENAGDDIFLTIVAGLESLLEELSPDVVVASAGFGLYDSDSHLTLTRLTEASFYRLGEVLSKYRTVAVMELGFSSGIENGLPAFMAGLSGISYRTSKATSSSSSVWSEFEELNRDSIDFV